MLKVSGLGYCFIDISSPAVDCRTCVVSTRLRSYKVLDNSHVPPLIRWRVHDIHSARNTLRPILISSPGCNTWGLKMRRLLTNVPLAEPMSSIQ